tara:strand:+ start:254 stop:781 length:528 start_codon:yes stop_codon:yes gene_type:complete
VIKIIDNLLPHNQWKELHDYFLPNDDSKDIDCPYYFLDHMVEDDHFQFVHPIARACDGHYFNRIRINRIAPILRKLDVDFLLRAKVNMTSQTHEPFQSIFHTDTEHNNLTAIYYFNTCNGKTRFEDPEIDDVDTVANRVLIFPSKKKHCTVTTTDAKVRVVLNVNYLPTIHNAQR